YQFASFTPGAVDQSLLVPAAAPGDWFILVYGEAVPQPAGFTLLASSADVIVRSVSPDRMPGAVQVLGSQNLGQDVAEPVELVIEGAGFRDVASVELITDTGLVVARANGGTLALNVDSSERLRALILGGFTYQGPLSVRVTNQDGTVGLLENAIESVGA